MAEARGHTRRIAQRSREAAGEVVRGRGLSRSNQDAQRDLLDRGRHLSVAEGEDQEAGAQRLRRALEVMNTIVRLVWPRAGEVWRDALVSLHEAEGHLTAVWRDEDAFDEFWMAVDLGWRAVAEEGSTVTHENADPGGAATLRYGQLY